MNTKTGISRIIRIVRLPLLALLYLYTRYISLLFAPRCRFYPSCSRYAYEAVYIHGALKGLWLAARRLLKCHPWHEGGIDHIPPPQNTCCTHHPHHPKENLP
jgi:putative membrane protein insertion efficiency factor